MQTLGLAAIGVVLGTGASWALARLLSGFLFGVTPTDPITFLGMAVILTTVAAMGGYLPARRASRIDPMAGFAVNPGEHLNWRTVRPEPVEGRA